MLDKHLDNFLISNDKLLEEITKEITKHIEQPTTKKNKIRVNFFISIQT